MPVQSSCTYWANTTWRRSIAAAGAGNQVGGGLAAGHADQRGGRSVLFKAAALAAGAGQTVAVGDDMPQFRGQPGWGWRHTALMDNAPAMRYP